MHCSGHFRILLLTVAILLPGPVALLAQTAPPQDLSQTNNTEVHLHWGPRPGVVRYRLQLAGDRAFADIVFDRVVTGNDFQSNDLPPGRYYWRIAALTDRLGDFSPGGVVEVRKRIPVVSPTPRATPSPVIESSRTKPGTNSQIVARGGWRAAVGDIAHPVLAHLRSTARFDLIGINNDGVIFALDAASGVALWTTGRRAAGPARITPGSSSLLLLRSRAGLDNVVVLAGVNISVIEGASGRELWRATLPAPATSGTVVSDTRSTAILLVDNSLARVTVLDANNGKLLTQTKLPHRVVGTPLALSGQDAGRVVLAYDNGKVEIRDLAGAVVRAGDAGSPCTTSPLFVKGRPNDFILVGTRSGLTALTAAELTPLGMVATRGDVPRGTLYAQDLDGDGATEVIMNTDRGRVIAVSAVDGKIIWEANVGNESQAVGFADLDGDRVLDVVLAGVQSFALALSGRDGSLVWKDNEPPVLAANHSVSSAPRSIVTMPFGSGSLLIAGDPSRTGLRALEFPKVTVPLKH